MAPTSINSNPSPDETPIIIILVKPVKNPSSVVVFVGETEFGVSLMSVWKTPVSLTSTIVELTAKTLPNPADVRTF